VARPLVSVIISAYNRPSMLEQALISVRSQTYDPIEILIQDDSTNDACEKIVEIYRHDARIHYSRNRPPLGTSLNLRAGYRSSRGKYFCTLNDDDLYHAKYIETMVEAMERDSGYSIAFSDSYLIDQNGQIKEEETEANTRDSYRSLLQEGSVENTLEVGLVSKSIPGMLALFRRDSIDLDDFPPEVSSGYDYWVTYLALRDGSPIYYTPQRLTYYRIHDGSQTASFVDPEQRLRFSKYSQFIHERFLADPRLKSIHSALYPRLAQAHSLAGFSRLRLRDRRQAFREFVASYRVQPGRTAVLGFAMCLAPLSAIRFALNRRG
jgi:glycosyltransferase involved in cell wall biosynthesis